MVTHTLIHPRLDFAALKHACDEAAGACGTHLWHLARQIVAFGAAHDLPGYVIARGIGRSRGYVSRAMKAARLPEPRSEEERQRVYEIFHGVNRAARSGNDLAAVLKRAVGYARRAVKLGAEPIRVEQAIHEGIADVEAVFALSKKVSSIETLPTAGSTSQVVPAPAIQTAADSPKNRAPVWPPKARRITWKPFVVGLVIFLGAPVSAQLPCGYEVDTIIGPQCGFGTANVHGLGISENGDVCGDLICPGGEPDALVSWNAVGLLPLPGMPAGTSRSSATDIADGVICGWFESTSRFAFRWSDNVAVSLGTLGGGTSSEALAINSSGIIVGWWGNVVTGPGPIAFRWEGGVMQDLSASLTPPNSEARDISNNGVITGWMGLPGHPIATPGFSPHAFVWQKGQVTDLGLMPGSVGTAGWAINNHNQVCGIAWFLANVPAGFVRRGFLWQNGTFVDLGLIPGDRELFPADISDDGTIVGWRGVPGPGSGTSLGGGFVWKAGVLRNIADLVPSSAEHVSSLRAINNSGEIAADQVVSLSSAGVRLRPIPRLLGDTNCDRMVNVNDLLEVILHWFQHGVDADVNGSGVVDVDDLLLVILNWG